MAQEYDVRVQETTQQQNRRSRMETYCDILKAIAAGAEKPTHVMYKANLSWTVMQSYLKSLEGRGLVMSQETEGKKTYRLSDRGFQLLKQFMSIRDDLSLNAE